MREHLHLDLAGKEICVGDWVVQAYNKGRCAAIKFAMVVEVSNKLTYVGCTGDHWGVASKYSVYYPERSLMIDKSVIPDHIVDKILEKAHEK